MSTRSYAISSSSTQTTPICLPKIVFTQSLSDFVRAGRLVDGPVVVNAAWDDETIEKIACLTGADVNETRTFGRVRKIAVSEKETSSVALSCAEHPPHTDGTFWDSPPRAFLLGFEVCDASGGGESLFWYLGDVLLQLSIEDIEILKRQPVIFERRDDRGFVDRWTGPLLTTASNGDWRMRWRFDDQVQPVPADGNDREHARTIARVHKLIRELEPIRYAAQEGDLILVPNFRWAHGRTELAPNSSRLVSRCWIA